MEAYKIQGLRDEAFLVIQKISSHHREYTVYNKEFKDIYGGIICNSDKIEDLIQLITGRNASVTPTDYEKIEKNISKAFEETWDSYNLSSKSDAFADILKKRIRQ